MRARRVPWREPRWLIISMTAVLASASVASACTDTTRSGRAPGTTTHAPATSGTASTASDDRAAVLAAYQRFWQVWLRANDPPNPSDPAIAEVETGAQLAGTLLAIERDRDRGERIRLPAKSQYHHTASATIDRSGMQAMVSDCAVDDSIVIQSSTGRVVDNSIETQRITATMIRIGRWWKVSSSQIVRSWPGISAC